MPSKSWVFRRLNLTIFCGIIVGLQIFFLLFLFIAFAEVLPFACALGNFLALKCVYGVMNHEKCHLEALVKKLSTTRAYPLGLEIFWISNWKRFKSLAASIECNICFCSSIPQVTICGIGRHRVTKEPYPPCDLWTENCRSALRIMVQERRYL